MATPTPSVAFEDFGESFNFKLYVFYDVSKDVETDLRIAILDALHEAGLRKMAYLSDAQPPAPEFGDSRRTDSPPRITRRQDAGAYS